jgi:hypothetical protein
LFIPVNGEEATVAPDNTHLNILTEQLSAVTGETVVTIALQAPADVGCEMFVGQVIVGLRLSVIVTVNEQVEVLPLGSVAV